MAVRRLPVLQRDPFERPRTVGDCRGGYRPCPFVTCRFNLLTDVLEDGTLVINATSKRLSGAERTIPNKHDSARSWYVEVHLARRYSRIERPAGQPAIFMMGPFDDAIRARAIAESWQAENGPRTCRVHRILPDNYELVGRKPEGTVDTKFEAEAEDAVERWFDEPNAELRSCLIDEINRLDRDDDEYLLEQISEIMFVSRERVRQVELAATAKLESGLRAAGLSVSDILDKD